MHRKDKTISAEFHTVEISKFKTRNGHERCCQRSVERTTHGDAPADHEQIVAVRPTTLKKIRAAGNCGAPSNFVLQNGQRLRCNLPLDHGGEHSWQKYFL